MATDSLRKNKYSHTLCKYPVLVQLTSIRGQPKNQMLKTYTSSALSDTWVGLAMQKAFGRQSLPCNRQRGLHNGKNFRSPAHNAIQLGHRGSDKNCRLCKR